MKKLIKHILNEEINKYDKLVNYVVDNIMSKTSFEVQGRNKKTPGFVRFPFADRVCFSTLLLALRQRR